MSEPVVFTDVIKRLDTEFGEKHLRVNAVQARYNMYAFKIKYKDVSVRLDLLVITDKDENFETRKNIVGVPEFWLSYDKIKTDPETAERINKVIKSTQAAFCGESDTAVKIIPDSKMLLCVFRYLTAQLKKELNMSIDDYAKTAIGHELTIHDLITGSITGFRLERLGELLDARKNTMYFFKKYIKEK